MKYFNLLNKKTAALKCLFCLFFFILFSSYNTFAQTLNVEVNGTNLYYSEGGCSDCAGFGDQPDPQWRVRINLGGSDYDWNDGRDNGSCGWRGITNSTWVNNVNVASGSSLNLYLNGWEVDNTFLICDGNDNQYRYMLTVLYAS